MSDVETGTSTEAVLVGVDQADLEMAQTGRGGLRRRWSKRGQRGMTTAEYAVGTIASVTFAGVLISVFRDPAIMKALLDLLLWVLRQFVG